MEKSIFFACSFFALLITQTAYGQYYSPAVVTPPVGNSPKLVVKTTSAYFVYTCVNGAWVRTYGYATLVDVTTNAVVGNYTTTRDGKGEIGTWTILNSAGDVAESGYTASIVTGRVMATSYKGVGRLPEQLLIATSHVYAGAVSTVSYIQKFSIGGGLPPPKSECSTKKSVTVPFTAEFCLWTQDTVPAQVPGELWAPGRVLEGFFCQGQITFKYNGSGWAESGRVGTLYSLPGTPALGKYTRTNNLYESWTIWNPNGVILYGASSKQVVVGQTGCPWSLSKVTSGSGPMMSIGDAFTHVQTTSTRGGMAPSYSTKPTTGETKTVGFSAILWFYVSQST